MDISEAREIARKSPPSTVGLDDAALQSEIEAISQALRRPGLTAFERIALNEDRQVFRAALTQAGAQ